MERKPVTSQVSNAVMITVRAPSPSPAPLPRAFNTEGGPVSGGAPFLYSLPSGQEPVMMALPVSQPLVGEVPLALPVGAHVAWSGGQEPVMVALPVSQPLAGNVPVALRLTHGRVRGMPAPRSGGRELVSGQPVPDLNAVPAVTVEPPTSKQGLPNPNAVTLAVAPLPSQALIPFNTVPAVTVAVAPPTSQGLPGNVLPPATLSVDAGNLMRCLRCYHAFAFSPPRIPGLVPPSGFRYPNPLTAPMLLSPPPASAISTMPFPVCSDPNHLVLTMQHARMDAAPELIWWRPPSFQPEHEDLVRISLGPPSSVDLDLGL